MYRRQAGEYVRMFCKHIGCKYGIRVLVLFFIGAALLVGVYKCINDIYGVRTSLFLTSQRMPSRYVAYRYIYNYENIIIYGCEVENIYKCVHAAKMENVGRRFLGRYLINTSLVVCCNNNETQKCAA